jgi:hypothetical protein
MAHYRYCVYALHVFSISCPVLSKAFLAVHECSQLTCKFRENQLFRSEWIFVGVIIMSGVLCTSRCEGRVEFLEWRLGCWVLGWGGGIDVECSRIENRKSIVRNRTAVSELVSRHQRIDLCLCNYACRFQHSFYNMYMYQQRTQNSCD